MTGITELVSVSFSGSSAGNSMSTRPSCSDDGQLIAFGSFADNVIAGDTNGSYDVFLRDMVAGTTELIGRDDQGVPSAFFSRDPHVSRSGRYVAFSAGAPLVSADTNFIEDVYVLDRELSELSLASVAADGTPANSESFRSRISDDGRFVAFYSGASNLIPSDVNFQGDIFVKDLATGEVRRASESAAGEGANSLVWLPRHFGGRVLGGLLFRASNLVVDDTNGSWDVFVKSMVTGAVERSSLRPDGSESTSPGVMQSQVRLTQDGRQVTFHSEANDLVLRDFNNRRDVFVRDLTAGLTERISITPNGTPSNGTSTRAAVSSNGRFVSFGSAAINLVPGVTAVEHIYLRDRYGDGGLGTSFCVQTVNSTGAPGRVSATGVANVAANDVTLTASSLPPDTFGFFFTSLEMGAIPTMGSPLGRPLPGGPHRPLRRARPGTEHRGRRRDVHRPGSHRDAPAHGLRGRHGGETWHFQGWNRDSFGGQVRSVLTDALAISF